MFHGTSRQEMEPGLPGGWHREPERRQEPEQRLCLSRHSRTHGPLSLALCVSPSGFSVCRWVHSVEQDSFVALVFTSPQLMRAVGAGRRALQFHFPRGNLESADCSGPMNVPMELGRTGLRGRSHAEPVRSFLCTS